eukprot:6970249-Lingulodinium_polyedra.AAC.1
MQQERHGNADEVLDQEQLNETFADAAVGGEIDSTGALTLEETEARSSAAARAAEEATAAAATEAESNSDDGSGSSDDSNCSDDSYNSESKDQEESRGRGKTPSKKRRLSPAIAATTPSSRASSGRKSKGGRASAPASSEASAPAAAAAHLEQQANTCLQSLQSRLDLLSSGRLNDLRGRHAQRVLLDWVIDVQEAKKVHQKMNDEDAKKNLNNLITLVERARALLRALAK